MRLAILLAAMMVALAARAGDVPEMVIDMNEITTVDLVSWVDPHFPDGEEVVIYYDGEKVIKIWAAKAGEWRIEYVSTQEELHIPPTREGQQ